MYVCNMTLYISFNVVFFLKDLNCQLDIYFQYLKDAFHIGTQIYNT